MGHGRSLLSFPAHRHLPFLLAAAATIGCANPGPPRPPTLNLPSPVTDLLATRVGDAVQLTWTTPTRSTDDLPLAGALTAELCQAPSLAEAACRAVERVPAKSGPSQATLPLSPMSVAGPPALLVVRVRLFNAAGHAAGLSAPAFTGAGVAPPPVTNLRAQASPGGATVDWTAIPGADPVLLHRTLLTPLPASSNRHRNLDTDLQAETPQHTDPGGVLDHSVQQGDTYRYTAERLRSLEIEGHAITLRSPISSPVTVPVRDTFPPAAPTGLASVPGAPGEASPTIELSWDPNTEPDLAGYLVERAQPASPSTWTRLTPAPIAAPAFRDTTVAPGARYRYRISAVDNTGNQSRPSIPIEETAATP